MLCHFTLNRAVSNALITTFRRHLPQLAVDTGAGASAEYSSPCSASGSDDFLQNGRDGHFQTPCFECYVGSPEIAADACCACSVRSWS